MKFAIVCMIAGYLSGSVLYSRLYAALFSKKETWIDSDDKNPGTFNAFENGGMACGIFTVCGDVLKAWIPVWFYLHYALQPEQIWIALVAAAPVLGHLYPVFYHFHGGKGIAAAFGSCAGMAFSFYDAAPLLVLAVLFILFALIIRIRPHIYLTAAVFLLFPMLLYLQHCPIGAWLFALIVSFNVLLKLALSREPKPHLEVSFLCRH